MKTFKENFFVKTSYSYVNLLLKLFPILLIFFCIPLLGYSFSGKIPVTNLDLFKLFGYQKLAFNVSFQTVVLAIFVLVVNLSVVVALFFGLKRLNDFLKNVYEEKPFIEENGKHLKFIGIITMILTIVIYLSNVFAIPADTSEVISPTTRILILLGNSLGVVFNPYLIIGMIVLVIGEIIVHAAKLQEEIDLTV